MIKKTLIKYFIEGEEVAKALRIEKEGRIEYKYYVDGYNRPVKWKTFVKRANLDSDIIDKIKRSYWLSKSDYIFETYPIVNIILMENGASVVLSPYDRFIERVTINPHFYFDIVRRNGDIGIESSCTDYSQYDEHISVLAKIGYELQEKFYRKVMNTFQNRLNRVVTNINEIKDMFIGDEVIIQYISPTPENPVLEKIEVIAGLEVSHLIRDAIKGLDYVVVRSPSAKCLSKEQLIIKGGNNE